MLPKGSISRVYEYYFRAPEYRREIMRALREFFDRPDLDKSASLEVSEQGEGFFNEWFLFDFVLESGRTVLEEFISCNPLALNETEMDLYRNLRENTYGIFEVLAVERGRGLTLKDLQTGTQWAVQEVRATYDVEPGSVFLGRVGNVGGRYELVGANSFSWQGTGEATKKLLGKEKSKMTPRVAYAIVQSHERNGE